MASTRIIRGPRFGICDPPESHASSASPRPVQSKSFFDNAVERAQAVLRDAGKDASRLEGYVWHSNRHTFANRLVMAGAGVDLRTVQELGGWQSLAMVTKYAHLAPAHRLAAVEAIVRSVAVSPAIRLASSPL